MQRGNVHEDWQSHTLELDAYSCVVPGLHTLKSRSCPPWRWGLLQEAILSSVEPLAIPPKATTISVCSAVFCSLRPQLHARMACDNLWASDTVDANRTQHRDLRPNSGACIVQLAPILGLRGASASRSAVPTNVGGKLWARRTCGAGPHLDC